LRFLHKISCSSKLDDSISDGGISIPEAGGLGLAKSFDWVDCIRGESLAHNLEVLCRCLGVLSVSIFIALAEHSRFAADESGGVVLLSIVLELRSEPAVPECWTYSRRGRLGGI
jgi:hypothetical protein